MSLGADLSNSNWREVRAAADVVMLAAPLVTGMVPIGPVPGYALDHLQ